MLRRRCNAQRGGALVEFAVIAPIVFMFLIGGVELGYLIYEYHATDYAAKSAARWAAVHGANCGNTSGTPAWTSCPTASDGSSVTTFVKNTVPGLQIADKKFSVVTAWSTPDPGTYLNNATGAMTCDSGNQDGGCLVKVTVTNPVTVQIPLIKLSSFTLTSSSTAVVQ